jgi:HSP90 family molecular chaperone
LAEVTENLIERNRSGDLLDGDDGKSRDERLVQIYDLAMHSRQGFDRERMERFLERSNQLLTRIVPH